MLTLPKWKTVWLMCQYSSTGVSKKRMYSNSEGGILENLITCCRSASKNVALEALKCWRMWIESQQNENWKSNDVCYTAVQPLLTRKFHPLVKDDEITEIKLSLLWLALHKTQALMHLEGPQHILEVFIQSCLTWLSCLDDLHDNIRNLILRLLKFLFPSEEEIEQENEKFPPLNNDIWKSNKLFCRVLTHWVELFRHWTKIKEKTDLLYMWKYFLVHCEQAFKLVPIPFWHQIFKLVENICSDNKELIIHKFSLLHLCITSLTSVLSNSKFIDCNKGLTTPAEALLRVVVNFCINHKGEYMSFEIVVRCFEVCQVLSSLIIQANDYESCFCKLSKIEEIELKPLLWAIWCGFANGFRNKVNDDNWEDYSEMDLKLYRKLRSVAVNFDLDKKNLDEKSIYLVQSELYFLRVSNTYCKNCLASNEKKIEEDITLNIGNQIISAILSQRHPEKEEKYKFDGGIFGFDVKTSNVMLCSCPQQSRSIDDSLMEIDVLESKTFEKKNQRIEDSVCRSCLMERDKKTLNYKCYWIGLNLDLENMNLCGILQLFCRNIESERPMIFKRGIYKRFLFAPTCITNLLEELRNIAEKSFDSSTNDFVEKVKKFENKIKKGIIFNPMKLFVSFKGMKGVEFYSNVILYWNDLNQIVNDIDFIKNLNILKAKNEKSVVWLSMFLFLINFTKNLYFETKEHSLTELRKLDCEEELILIKAVISFMQKVSYYKSRLSNFVFLENMNKILPIKRSNPIVIWTNFVSANNSIMKESINEHFSIQEYDFKIYNINLMNIFNNFDEFQNRISKQTDLRMSLSQKTRKRKVSSGNDNVRFSSRLKAWKESPLIPEKAVTIMENKNVTIVQAFPYFFRKTMTLSSDWRSPNDFHINETVIEEKASEISRNDIMKKSKRRKKNSNQKKDTTRGIRTLQSSVIKAQIAMSDHNYGTVQDENVNIEIDKKKNRRMSTRLSAKRNNKNDAGSTGRKLKKSPLQRQQRVKKIKLCSCNDHIKKKLNESCKDDEKHLLSPSLKFRTNVSNLQKSPKSFKSKYRKKNEIFNSSERNNFLSNKTDDCYSEIKEKTIPTIEGFPETGVVKMEKIVDVIDMVIVAANNVKNETVNDVKVEVNFIKQEGVDLEISNSFDEIPDSTKNSNEEVAEDKMLKSSDEITINSIENIDLHENKIQVKQDEVTASGSPARIIKTDRGTKRNWKCFEESNSESIGIKKLKTEMDICNGNEELVTEILTEEESSSAAVASKPTQNLLHQSRGSRMLALVPESPKLNGFLDSPPSSKFQTMRAPNVQKNSRASKMLALLPELQEISPSDNEMPFIETMTQKTILENDNKRKGSSGNSVGIMHHLTPIRNKLGTSGESPKRSPIRRRSIRFDDDRNEMQTYFKDSPPCLIKRGMRFKAFEK